MTAKTPVEKDHSIDNVLVKYLCTKVGADLRVGFFPKEIAQYLWPKVLADLKGGSLSSEVAMAINNYQVIDKMREVVGKGDVATLLDAVDNTPMALGNLAMTLLKPHERRRLVRTRLTEAWKNAKDYERRNSLMYRLLDYEDLPKKIHKAMYDDVLANLDTFIDKAVAWYGGEESVLAAVKQRLKDTRFPPSKHWFYLIGLLGSSDKKGADAILKKYGSNNDAFVAFVAKDVRGRIIKGT